VCEFLWGKAIGAEGYLETLEGSGMRLRMKCPECKREFPKGGRFCPNCGFEPMKRGRLMLGWVILAPISVAIGTWILVSRANEEHWFGAFSGGLTLVLWVWLGIHGYRWFRWTRPVDAHMTADDLA
jgi:hypothetical protein